MSRYSPPATRHRARSNQYDDDNDDDLDDSYLSHTSLRSSGNDSSSSYRSSPRSRHDSSSWCYDDSVLSSPSPSKSHHTSISGTSPDKLYPDIQKMTHKMSLEKMKKTKNLYPAIPKSSDSDSNYSKRAGNIDRSPLLETSQVTIDGSRHYFTWISILLALALVVYLVVQPGSSSNQANANKMLSGFELFEHDMKSLQSSFPKQTKRFWGTILASARHIFEQRDPCYPSVILMASHDKNRELSACIALKIVHAFSKSKGVNPNRVSSLTTDANDIRHLGSDEQKQNLDDSLQFAFRSEGMKGYVISNIQSLSPTAALLLHGFCDGDNAPFQDVMILLTLQVADGVEFHSVKQVEDLLVSTWSAGLHLDKLTALMSRVANNPVVLMSEDVKAVQKTCLV